WRDGSLDNFYCQGPIRGLVHRRADAPKSTGARVHHHIAARGPVSRCCRMGDNAEQNSTHTIPFVRTSSYPVRAGNVVRPLIDGVPAFRRICEAIDAAEHSVWLTVTFMWSTFEMPDSRGSALDVLDRAASRGIDVRIIFWRPDVVTTGHARNAFWGAAEHRAL